MSRAPLPSSSGVKLMPQYQQLTIWDFLEEAAETPGAVKLSEVWQHLDTALSDLSVEQQLETAARASTQIADIIKSRADRLLGDWQDSHNPDGPAVGTDIFSGLVRMTMHLDLEDLKESVEPQIFKKHGERQKSPTFAPLDTVVAVVDKSKVLAALEVMTAEKLQQLAGVEDVSKWQRAIAFYIKQQVYPAVCLTDLQLGLGMPLVEVWLGLLLGDFTLEQRGEFYQAEDIWIRSI